MSSPDLPPLVITMETVDGWQESIAGSEEIPEVRIIPRSSSQKCNRPSQMEVVEEELEDTKEGQDYDIVLEEGVAENAAPVTPTPATPSRRCRRNDIPCDVSNDDTLTILMVIMMIVIMNIQLRKI
eukprot:3702649-Ditylum_brightwellii.AAC.1